MSRDGKHVITIIDEVGVAVFVSNDLHQVRIVPADAPNEPLDHESPIIRLAPGRISPGVPLALFRRGRFRHLRLGGC